MDREIVGLWEKNKHMLERYLRETPQEKYNSYEALVKLIVKYVLNGHTDEYDAENIAVIDDGDYQGTLIFLIHRAVYQPGITDYLVTYVYYGSCSGCDTLQSIYEYHPGLPTEEQVEAYMTLCLHIIQRMKPLYE